MGTELPPSAFKTNLRFFSTRGQNGIHFSPAALFPWEASAGDSSMPMLWIDMVISDVQKFSETLN